MDLFKCTQDILKYLKSTEKRLTIEFSSSSGTEIEKWIKADEFLSLLGNVTYVNVNFLGQDSLYFMMEYLVHFETLRTLRFSTLSMPLEKFFFQFILRINSQDQIQALKQSEILNKLVHKTDSLTRKDFDLLQSIRSKDELIWPKLRYFYVHDWREPLRISYLNWQTILNILSPFKMEEIPVIHMCSDFDYKTNRNLYDYAKVTLSNTFSLIPEKDLVKLIYPVSDLKDKLLSMLPSEMKEDSKQYLMDSLYLSNRVSQYDNMPFSKIIQISPWCLRNEQVKDSDFWTIVQNKVTSYIHTLFIYNLQENKNMKPYFGTISILFISFNTLMKTKIKRQFPRVENLNIHFSRRNVFKVNSKDFNWNKQMFQDLNSIVLRLFQSDYESCRLLLTHFTQNLPSRTKRTVLFPRSMVFEMDSRILNAFTSQGWTISYVSDSFSEDFYPKLLGFTY